MADFDFIGVIDSAWDRATGIFDKWVDLELGKEELEIARKAQAAELRAAQEAAARQAAFTLPTDSGGGFNLGSPNTLILVGAAALLLVLLLRRT